MHFVGHPGGETGWRHEHTMFVIEWHHIGHRTTQRDAGMITVSFQLHARRQKAGNGQARLPSQLPLNERQHVIDEPTQRVMVWAFFFMNGAKEQHARAIGKFPPGWRHVTEVTDHGDISESDATQCRRFRLAHGHDTLTEKGIAELCDERRFQIEWPRLQTGSLPLPHGGERLGVQYQQRRMTAARNAALEHRAQTVEIMRARDPYRLVIAGALAQELPQ